MNTKTLILFLFLMLCAFMVNAQIAYYSAVEIKKNCVIPNLNGFAFDPSKKNELSALLRDFLPEDVKFDTSLEVDAILGVYIDNPFFGKEISPLVGQASGVISGLTSKVASTLGGLDVTNIAQGLSQFMIKRAKEELTVAFFERFRNFSEENEEFGVLFPKTTDNLENLISYQYPEMLPALRTGFLDDIKNITYHLDDVLELPRYHELLKNFPEIKVAIRSVRLVHEIESGNSHPSEVLEKFAHFREWTDPITSPDFKNFGSSVKLAAIFSTSLRTELLITSDTLIKIDTTGTLITVDTLITSDTLNPDHAWINFRQMEGLVTDEITFKIFLGLIHQLVKNESIQFYHDNKPVKFDSIMGVQRDNLILFESKVSEFIALANIVDETLDTIKDKKNRNAGLTNDDLYGYIDISLDVMEYAFSLGKLFYPNIKSDEYTIIPRKANDLYRNVYKQEYTQAVSNAMEILETVHILVDKSKRTIIDTLQHHFPRENFFQKPIDKLNADDKNFIATEIVIAEAAKDTHTVALLNKYSALYTNGASFSKFPHIITTTTKYGLFMANMINADSPEEVSALLESATLPVGSYSIKKNSAFNISIQSYLGGYVKFGSLENDNNTAWANDFGVIAPIGIAFSAGFKKWGSATLFATLLDVGAIADYQLTTDTIPVTEGDSVIVSKDFKIELGQIFSPGAYLVWGLPWNLPLSLGVGGQYGPGLGKIETSGTTIVNNPQWRLNVFLAVDIPFFNLVNVPKKGKR